jgi:hypothetical protein
MLHDTEEPIGLVLFLTVGYAEIKQGLQLLRQLRKLHEDVLLCSHSQESRQINRCQVQVLWVLIFTYGKMQQILGPGCHRWLP